MAGIKNVLTSIFYIKTVPESSLTAHGQPAAAARPVCRTHTHKLQTPVWQTLVAAPYRLIDKATSSG